VRGGGFGDEEGVSDASLNAGFMEAWARHVCNQRHRPETVERISYRGCPSLTAVRSIAVLSGSARRSGGPRERSGECRG
jgi:hypothetical protein